MLKMVDGTGIIGVDMICPLGVSTPQPPNYDRVELEGAGMLALPNSLDAPLERLELGGKTEQVTTTGKNLLPDKFSIYAEGKSKINLKLQIGNYVYSSKTSKNLYILHEDKSNITNGWTATNKFNFKIDKEETIEVRIETENPLEILPMIRDETESDSYEPYTGGKPSPSPEYQQEIKNVGKWNEEKQKYEVDVKVVGKNLFDVNYFTENENYQNKDGDANWKFAKLKVKPNTVYTVSKSKNTGVNGGINKSLTYVGALSFSNDINTVKITSDDTGVLYVIFFYRGQDVNILKEMDIQVELGDGFTEYEPYKEQTLALALDQPLRGIGEMKDELSESGILRRVKSIALNGSEKWYKYENSAFVAMNCYGLKIDDLEVKNYNLTTLCNFFKWARFPQDIESQAAHGGYIYISVPKETYPDLESFKGWLAKNIPVLEYRLKEPALEELSEEDKASIRALKTYYPTTVITADGGELDPDIKVTYRKEI